MTDIEDYRAYLAAHNPITEFESRFLDTAHDLVSLAPSEADMNDNGHDSLTDDALTPMPRTAAEASFLPSSPTSDAGSSTKSRASQELYIQPAETPFRQIAILTAMAFLLPILLFTVIPGFVGRMAVVLVVGLGAIWALMQSSLTNNGRSDQSGLGAREWLVTFGIYGGVMAVAAGII
jgi:hypothetical protein